MLPLLLTCRLARYKIIKGDTIRLVSSKCQRAMPVDIVGQ